MSYVVALLCIIQGAMLTKLFKFIGQRGWSGMLRDHILVIQLHILPLRIGYETEIYLQARSPPFFPPPFSSPFSLL